VAIKLFDSSDREQKKPTGTTIQTGTVINNCDLIAQGKVLVRIPALDQEVWARLSAPGGGSGAGFLYVPRADDEVLVAMVHENPENSFILGGLWGTQDSPPVSTPEATTKRVLKTGLTSGVGHEVEFDDAQQSISIISTTKQKIVIDPQSIELTNTAGTLKITLDNKSQTITIKGVNVTVEADATLTLKGRKVELKSEPGPLDISSSTVCSISGTTAVKIN
jgi:uncharacterized protein involved in type VI secretion and phage assembly